MNKKIIPLIAITVTVLGGCTQVDKPVVQSPETQQTRTLPPVVNPLQIPTGTSMETQLLEEAVKNSDPTKAPEVTPVSSSELIKKPSSQASTDATLYRDALKGKDASLCEKIQEAELKERCSNDVKAMTEKPDTGTVVTTSSGTTTQEGLLQ